ncbi:glycosyltransferase family 9 protein [Paraburkholderia sp. A1RI-2L]|uniref:glycosyltransferase family 9 protein n=1 Tax=Paraburkholderia sp. A1RI-2L TaxID=3028367 RepID=UPI003B7AF4AB
MNGAAFAIAPREAHARAPRARSTCAPWHDEVKRILAVRLDHLGDVLMTTPALRALRDSAGARHITLLASPAGAAIARHLPDVDEVIEYDAPWTNGERITTGAGAIDDALLARLRAGRFDAAAIFTVYSQNPLPAATLCFLAGIERRLAHCRENPYALLTHWLPEREPHAGVRHEVERQLALVRSVGAESDDARMRVRVDAGARATLARKQRERGVEPARSWIVVHPGASAASRRYPAALHAEAIDLLAPFISDPVLLTGSAAEAALTRDVASFVQPAAQLRLVDLAGALTLGEFIALLDSASLLIANNSGPVHLAAALGTPVVDLYALTNPQHTPWMTPHRVLYHDVPCRWCYRGDCPEGHHACLRGVPPCEVAQAARELLGHAAAAPPGPPPPLAPIMPITPS